MNWQDVLWTETGFLWWKWKIGEFTSDGKMVPGLESPGQVIGNGVIRVR